MMKLSYKEREKRRREHEILLEARRLIREGGFTELNMDSLASAVGISKPTLYQHFRSKEDLIACVLVNYIQEMEDHLHSTSEVAPLERLKVVLRIMLVQRYGVDGALINFETESIFALLHAHPEVVAAKKRLMTEIDQVVEAGKACGEIITSVPTPMVGCLLVRMFGLPATMQALLPTEAGRPVTPLAVADLIDHVIELFARSIAQNQTSI